MRVIRFVNLESDTLLIENNNDIGEKKMAKLWGIDLELRQIL
jgi:hypothetical protein